MMAKFGESIIRLVTSDCSCGRSTSYTTAYTLLQIGSEYIR